MQMTINKGRARMQMTINRGKARMQMTISRGKARMHKWENPNNKGKARTKMPTTNMATGAWPV